MNAFLYEFVNILFTALTFAVFARVLLSWFPMNPDNPIIMILNEVTDPIIRPLRRVVPPLGMLDLTPIVALVLLQVIRNLLLQAIATG